MVITAPSWVKYKLWHAGKIQKFRVTPARRKVSARYGKPPTFGRLATAFCRAA